MAAVRSLTNGIEFETDDLSARALVAEGAAEWVGEPPVDPEAPADEQPQPEQEQAPVEPAQPAEDAAPKPGK